MKVKKFKKNILILKIIVNLRKILIFVLILQWQGDCKFLRNLKILLWFLWSIFSIMGLKIMLNFVYLIKK